MGLDDESRFSRKISRRELLRGPFTHFGKEYDPEDPKTNPTNKLIEGIGESLSLAGILYVAYRGSQDQLITYQVDSESRISDLPQFPETVASIEQFNQAILPINAQLDSLDRIWTRAYEDYVCNPVFIPDGKGGTTMTLQCDTEWNEPSKLISTGLNHNKIGNWKNSGNGLQNRVGDAESQTPQAFDLSNNGLSLYYKEKVADIGGQVVLAGLAYGAIGALFCLYEEGISSIARDEYVADVKPFIDDAQYIKRRTFFKLGAVGLMALKIRDIQRAFIGDNAKVLDQIKANTAQVLNEMDISSEENFKRFFGMDPVSIRNYLVDIKTKTAGALNSGYSGSLDSDWGRVKPEIENTNAHADSAIASFDEYFSFDPKSETYEIPSTLTTATKNLWGTKEVIKFADSQSFRIYTRHLTDALGMAVGLAGLVLIGEKLLFPLPERIRDMIKSANSSETVGRV